MDFPVAKDILQPSGQGLAIQTLGTRGRGKPSGKEEVESPGVLFAPELEMADLALKSFLVVLAFIFEKQEK